MLRKTEQKQYSETQIIFVIIVKCHPEFILSPIMFLEHAFNIQLILLGVGIRCGNAKI